MQGVKREGNTVNPRDGPNSGGGVPSTPLERELLRLLQRRLTENGLIFILVSCRRDLANVTMFHPQDLSNPGRPVSIWDFIKPDDVEIVFFEHLPNFFRGCASAELNIVARDSHSDGLFSRRASATEF